MLILKLNKKIIHPSEMLDVFYCVKLQFINVQNLKEVKYMNEQFMLQIAAYLNTKGIKTDFDKIKKEINSDKLMAKLGIDSSASKQQIRDLATEIHKSLDGIFKNAGIDEFKISVKDVESMINGSLKQAEKDSIARQKQKTKAIEEAKKAQELYNQKVKEGKNVLVDACIGSGKTTAIQQLCNELPTNLKILYLTYNRLLKIDAKSKIKNKNVTVTNYHGFAFNQLKKAGISTGIPDLIQTFNNKKPHLDRYDILIIDEYQDIEQELAEMLYFIRYC
jgi:superfamily I DNA/RNA helicase